MIETGHSRNVKIFQTNCPLRLEIRLIVSGATFTYIYIIRTVFIFGRALLNVRDLSRRCRSVRAFPFLASPFSLVDKY